MVKLLIFIGGIILVIILEFLWRRKHGLNIYKAEQIGKVLFESKQLRFEEYTKTYKTNKHNFDMIYGEDVSGVGKPEKMSLLDFILLFGDHEDEILTIDWRGEENEEEIQSWCEEKLGYNVDWYLVKQLKAKSIKVSIEKLIQAINNDLNKINSNLIVFDSANDSFELAVISTENLNKLIMLDKHLLRKI